MRAIETTEAVQMLDLLLEYFCGRQTLDTRPLLRQRAALPRRRSELSAPRAPRRERRREVFS
jgi:hypothetical protein